MIQQRSLLEDIVSDIAPAGTGRNSGASNQPSLGPTLPGPSLPSSSQAEASFEQMINDMVDKIVTCQIFFKQGHFSSSCTSTLKCLGCSRVGHRRRDCARFAQHLGLVRKPKPVVGPVSEVQATKAGNISLTGYLPNLDSSASIAPSTSSHFIHLGPSTPLGSPPATPPPPPEPPSPPLAMANFPLDPMQYVPAGHHIIDVGDAHWLRTFVTPHVQLVRRHEDFMLAEVMPVPEANEIGAAREEVADWLEAHGYQVRSVQPWINAVGLFRVRDPAVRFSLLQLPPAFGKRSFCSFYEAR